MSTRALLIPGRPVRARRDAMASKQVREGEPAESFPERAKVLVIGSSGHAGVACIDWMQAEIPNIADFHVVVVNTGSLTIILEDWAARSELQRDEWDALYKRLNHIQERLMQVVKTRGTVYAIVYPFTEVRRRGISQYTSHLDNRGWNPLPVSMVGESGDTKEIRIDAFARYFGVVERWTFHFAVDYEYGFRELEDHYGGDYHVSPQLESIAINRQRQAIGLRFAYGLHRYTRPRAVGEPPPFEPEPAVLSGSFYYLPSPTRVSDDEAVRMLLEDLCGIEARTTAPAWAESLRLEGSRELEGQIDARQGRIDEVRQELEPLLEEKARREGFKAILYETGVAPLQNVVEAAFKELGFKTLPSDVSDEFYVEFNGTRALIEVKGVEKSASLTDLRQLLDYQLEHEQKYGTAIKSILVVNAWRKLPPERRGLAKTPVFPDNVVKRASANHIALLDTLELFKALNACWLGEVDTQHLFELLMATSGIVSLA
jgi:hypothetical protein